MGGVSTSNNEITWGTSNRLANIQDASSSIKRSFAWRLGGDLYSDSTVGGDSYQYNYNALKRVVQVLKNGSEAGTYGYDYQGHRVWRSVDASGANTQYVFDTAGHLLAEHNGSTGAVQKEYIWLGDLPVAVVDWTTGSPFIYYIHTGQMDEPLVLTNASKAKVWDAWVNPWGKAGTFGTPSEAIDLRLPGQWLQLETNGLHQNWHRDYDPSIGRYVQADPLGIEAGQNPFAYAYDQPLTYSDPEGLCPAECKKLRGEIFLQFAKLQKEFLKYDPVEDAKGGFRMRGGG
ncbi:RHS repeat domain-containing protein [Caulobacter sp. KR2-114]|uniref:RHS repeat domain-containing protein n=1 Tax=Caulobacter sp. KR2-114 TaxID=3400912 RepID=UPI003C01ACDE